MWVGVGLSRRRWRCEHTREQHVRGSICCEEGRLTPLPHTCCWLRGVCEGGEGGAVDGKRVLASQIGDRLGKIVLSELKVVLELVCDIDVPVARELAVVFGWEGSRGVVRACASFLM